MKDLMLMPHNLEAEQLLLGALLADNRVFENITTKPEEFYAPIHQKLFEFMRGQIEKGSICDPGTISHAFANHADLQERGGSEYIRDLVQGVVTISGATHYASTIHDLWIRRELISGCMELSDKARNFEGQQNIRGEAEKLLTGLSETKKSRTFTGGEASTQALEYMEALRKGNSDVVLSGIHALDEWIGGFHPDGLYLIGARPGAGKTALGLNIADNVSATRSALFLSLEMSAGELAMRMIATRSGVPVGIQRSDKWLHLSQKTSIMEAHSDIGTRKLLIDDTPGLGIHEIKAIARRAKRKDNIALMVVDYIGLIAGNPKIQSKVHQIEEITTGLKGLSKELHIPIIGLVQLSRAVEGREDKRPRLADLRDSGSLEQDADMVMFVYRPNYYNRTTDPVMAKAGPAKTSSLGMPEQTDDQAAELIIDKYRQGQTGTVHLRFDGARQRFS